VYSHGLLEIEMKRRQSAIRVVLFLILLIPHLRAQKAPRPDLITITGTLQQVVGIGSETTGWAIRLDSELELAGKRLKSLEVNGDRREFIRLENKRVEASGKIVTRHGIERGEWPVLEVSTIREVNSK
jgi:hypothetical protein